MVKFGRHLEYYAASQHHQAGAGATTNDATVTEITILPVKTYDGSAAESSFSSLPSAPYPQLSSSPEEPYHHDVLYVVPYNDMKTKCIPPYTPEFLSAGGSTTGGADEKKAEDQKTKQTVSTDDAYFVSQRFKTEWRQCLANASRDFEKSTKTFWRRVFDGLESLAADNNDEETFENENTIDPDMIRGALPDTALRLYLSHSLTSSSSSAASVASFKIAEIQSLYTHLKNIHSTALINSEALRKLVKKFDKEMGRLKCHSPPTDEEEVEGHHEGYMYKRLSSRLLPEVYCANFNVGLPTVEAGLALIRSHLGLDEDEFDEEEHDEDVHAARIKFMSTDGGGASGGLAGLLKTEEEKDEGGPDDDVAGFFGLRYMNRSRDVDAMLVEKRKCELRWLRKLVESVKEKDMRDRLEDGNGYFGVDMISCLVGHRGFHSIKDKSDKRPIENSLMAYEAAWTNGIHLCECDIALTADDKLILAHDENFVRLALDLDDPLVHRNVGDLTYKEIMSLPLKSGNRPPLLFDVLRSAQVIGGDARMIVEIKPGNVEAGTALAKMFARHPQLMERCAVVMSFDAYAMQNLKRELELVFPSLAEETVPVTSKSAMKIGSPPDHSDLGLAAMNAAANTLSPLPPQHHHHVHRLGVPVSSSGVIPKIPTAMSIGDIKAHATAAAATDTTTSVHASLAGLGTHSKSIDQLGLTLDDLEGLGVRKDSFNFNPFGQLERVPSMHRQGSRSKLNAPLSSSPAGATLAQQPATTLETIPGGKRVENAKPHPSHSDEAVTSGISSAPPMVPSYQQLSTPPQHATTVVIPQLLLITRNGPAKNKEQEDALEVDVSKPSDIERAQSWLHGGSPRFRLDGLYMQYQPIMLEPKGIKAMERLTEQYSVGIWGANPKPDDYETFSKLVRECGVSYVNSGLPRRFMRNIVKSESSGNLLFMPDGSSHDKSTAADYMEQNSRTWPKQPKQTAHLGLPW